MDNQSSTTTPPPRLRCSACGNEDYFVEIVDFEAHLLNRQLEYVRTLHSELDRFECYQCGEEIDFDPYLPTNQESQNASF
jgi:hypothetical protein